jgi:uncharacterized membrane protein YeaQ/YmgE (transglycosylase-associated protein family)
MTLGSLLVLLVIAGVCGSIGRALARYSNVGCIGSIALGFIGALLGSWIARHLHLPELLTIQVGHERFPIVWSIVGSALFVAVLGFFTRDGDARRRRSYHHRKDD